MNQGLLLGFGARSKYGRTYQLTALQNGAATTRTGLNTVSASANAYTALSGALTANVLKTMLEVNSPGQLNWLAAHSADDTSRTIRVKVTMDDLVVFDSTSSAIALNNSGVVIVGGTSSSADLFQPIPYLKSLLIEVASSLTETDKVTIAYNNETWQAT